MAPVHEDVCHAMTLTLEERNTSRTTDSVKLIALPSTGSTTTTTGRPTAIATLLHITVTSTDAFFPLGSVGYADYLSFDMRLARSMVSATTHQKPRTSALV